MSKKEAIQVFEDRKVRTLWDDDTEEWYFSIVDVVAVLTDSVNPTAYWRKLKERLKKEGNQTVTDCHGFKMQAADGKMRKTDCADTEQLFRLIQSIPSPKAEPGLSLQPCFGGNFLSYLYFLRKKLHISMSSNRSGVPVCMAFGVPY
ncbi:Bro-N domain-containing protein [Chlorobium phaeovibrioides]|uniref:Bro-N domain-containing protein n=1 Tax=Chlorobium phaeovibrioides TaxID=1094 RepID=A0A5M8IE64_CHLPH|nr:Bro-N domain-containing protein [Chlorobium phaeovibrioides]KAA6233267.1 Bro-N domain-containing protein [Chlorobium phaeovibrioides]